jgi:hypothetical protein
MVKDNMDQAAMAEYGYVVAKADVASLLTKSQPRAGLV